MAKIIYNIIQDFIDIFFNFWFVFLVLFSLLFLSVIFQFSINGAEFNLIFIKHTVKIICAVFLIFILALIDKKVWFVYAYPIYIITLVLLLFVSIFGVIKLGAQRWIDLYFITIQPSELIKISTILALSRYYSQFNIYELRDIKTHFKPIVLLLIPVFLIMKQPDLGTAILVLGIGFSIIFYVKFPIKYIIMIFSLFMVTLPLLWFLLKPYQKNRVLTFLNPDRDPLGAGYHILQSKIAIGSGGFFGKGYTHGTQTVLDFLPEKNTDFIFTAISEEGGFIISLLIILLFVFLITKLYLLVPTTKKPFEKYICIGVTCMIFLHAFINISMVIGIVPVVGVPVPFLSYGGSSLITIAISLGIVFSSFKKKKAKIFVE